MLRAVWLGFIELLRSLTASEGGERMMIAAGTLGGLLLIGALLNPVVLAIGVTVLAGLLLAALIDVRRPR